jgi:hypothetical protein
VKVKVCDLTLLHVNVHVYHFFVIIPSLFTSTYSTFVRLSWCIDYFDLLVMLKSNMFIFFTCGYVQYSWSDMDSPTIFKQLVKVHCKHYPNELPTNQNFYFCSWIFRSAFSFLQGGSHLAKDLGDCSQTSNNGTHICT